MSFFFILSWVMSLIIAVLEVGNFEGSTDQEVFELLDKPNQGLTYPGMEYMHTPRFLRHFILLLRMSLGDFDFGETVYMLPWENRVFWVIWVLLVIITMVIFLNFIIAEVSASYADVQEEITGRIQQDRAQLIDEAEDMMLESQRNNPDKFPTYLVIREVDE